MTGCSGITTQLDLLEPTAVTTAATVTAASVPELADYDCLLVNSSAGKDSQASLDVVVAMARTDHTRASAVRRARVAVTAVGAVAKIAVVAKVLFCQSAR